MSSLAPLILFRELASISSFFGREHFHLTGNEAVQMDACVHKRAHAHTNNDSVWRARRLLPWVLSDRLRESQRGSFVWHRAKVVPDAAPPPLSSPDVLRQVWDWPSSPYRHHPQNNTLTQPRPNRRFAGSVLTCDSDELGSARSISTNKPPTTNKVDRSFASPLLGSAAEEGGATSSGSEPTPSREEGPWSGGEAAVRTACDQKPKSPTETLQPAAKNPVTVPRIKLGYCPA